MNQAYKVRLASGINFKHWGCVDMFDILVPIALDDLITQIGLIIDTFEDRDS